MHYYEWDGVTKLGDVWLRDWDQDRCLASRLITELNDQERMLRDAFQRLVDMLDLRKPYYDMIERHVPIRFKFSQDGETTFKVLMVLAEIKFICELTDEQTIILKLRVPELAGKEQMNLDEKCPL